MHSALIAAAAYTACHLAILTGIIRSILRDPPASAEAEERAAMRSLSAPTDGAHLDQYQ